MISSATFHVISYRISCWLICHGWSLLFAQSNTEFQFLTSEKISQVSDIVGHFALGFGLIATPFAILSGISSSPGSDVSSPLLVNKMLSVDDCDWTCSCSDLCKIQYR